MTDGAAELPTSLYAHFPWCVRKCPYCDFNSHPLKGDLREDDYVRTLLADLALERERFGDRALGSIYFGGGTPSLFSPAAFARLIRAAAAADDAEITLEANPGTLEHASFDAYRRAGITRVSLGAQTFDPEQLARLGRIHSPDDTRRAAEDVRAAGLPSFNLDLMYALPAQTPAQALADLEQAVRLAPPHISWYQLTIEPKTEFARRPPSRLPTSEAAAEIEDAGVDFLARHGYRRYEVSAYARDGHRSAHNMNYWQFGDYMGIGAGAHGKLTRAGGVTRTAKPSSPRRYLAADPGSDAAVGQGDIAAEFMMNALRLVDGVPRSLFAERTGLAFDAVSNTVAELADWGLMRRDRIALTERGFRQLDGVVARFL